MKQILQTENPCQTNVNTNNNNKQNQPNTKQKYTLDNKDKQVVHTQAITTTIQQQTNRIRTITTQDKQTNKNNSNTYHLT